jgi:hypothetical protein
MTLAPAIYCFATATLRTFVQRASFSGGIRPSSAQCNCTWVRPKPFAQELNGPPVAVPFARFFEDPERRTNMSARYAPTAIVAALLTVIAGCGGPEPAATMVPTVVPSKSGAGMITLVSDRDSNREICTMSADRRSVRKLTHDSGEDDSPAWSAAGAEIAFMYRCFTMWGTHIMNADGSNVRRLTTSGAKDTAPALNPGVTQE